MNFGSVFWLKNTEIKHSEIEKQFRPNAKEVETLWVSNPSHVSFIKISVPSLNQVNKAQNWQLKFALQQDLKCHFIPSKRCHTFLNFLN